MGIPLTLADSVDLIDKSIQNIWLKTSKIEQKSYYNKYYNVITGVTDYYEKDSSMTGLGEAARITENAIVTAESPVQGFDKTYTQVEFGKLLAVTKQMWKFGIKKRKLEGVVNQLRAACERKRERLCADRLDNGYSTSYTANDDSGNFTVTTTGGDGVELFSSSHTREDGGTNVNNIIYDGTTYNMDFDYDAIKAAHRTAALIKDGKGNDMEIDINRFIFKKGYTNAFRAREILRAIKAGGKGSLPGEITNDGAGVPEYEIIELPWITSNTAYWFAQDTSMINDQYGLQYKESQAIQLEGPNVVFKTGEMQYKATLMFDIGHNDSRGTFASKNTNAV